MYDKNGFWEHVSGDGEFQIEIVGDFCRQRVLELADARPGKIILDAGCGNGRLSRVCATAGAEVWAFDRDIKMLRVGNKFEQKKPLGVKYYVASLFQENFGLKWFSKETIGRVSAVLCSNALMHNPRYLVLRFMTSAMNVLRPGGKVILSVVPHRDLLEEGLRETARDRDEWWIRYKLLPGVSFEEVWSGTMPCIEEYKNGITGEVFISTLFLHDHKFLVQEAITAGFQSVEVEFVTITPEMLGEVGFWLYGHWDNVKAYTIVTARKPG